MTELDPMLSKWIGWLAVIRGEVRELVIAKDTFQKIQRLIENNPALHQSNSFYQYLSNTYVSHAVIGLRRQIKSKSPTISMARLFEEMIERPQILTRGYYISLYDDPAIEDLADEHFNQFAAQEESHIDPLLVKADLTRLRDASKRWEDFADRRDRDTTPSKELPTFDEVNAGIDLLNDLYIRYCLLFHACSVETLLPIHEGDWEAIFRVPWIPANNRITAFS
jgi:hypothetical protein